MAQERRKRVGELGEGGRGVLGEIVALGALQSEADLSSADYSV